MPEKLKPCPFCGGRAYLSERISGGYYVECESINGCLAESGNYDTRGQAIEAWNRRVMDTDELDRIASALDREDYCFGDKVQAACNSVLAARIRKAAVL